MTDEAGILMRRGGTWKRDRMGEGLPSALRSPRGKEDPGKMTPKGGSSQRARARAVKRGGIVGGALGSVGPLSLSLSPGAGMG